MTWLMSFPAAPGAAGLVLAGGLVWFLAATIHHNFSAPKPTRHTKGPKRR